MKSSIDSKYSVDYNSMDTLFFDSGRFGGVLPDTTNFYCILYYQVGDSLYPFLKTFDKNGNEIDNENIGIGYCRGMMIDIESCVDQVTIKENFEMEMFYKLVGVTEDSTGREIKVCNTALGKGKISSNGQIEITKGEIENCKYFQMTPTLKYLIRTSVILVVLSCQVVPAIAQIKIIADTLMRVGCQYDGPKDLIIETQEAYSQATFLDAHEWCLPFDAIDFSRNILIGCRYQGSNCDEGIDSSTLTETDTGYLIQFSINNRRACRDLSIRTVWFLLERPTGDLTFTFERVARQISK